MTTNIHSDDFNKENVPTFSSFMDNFKKRKIKAEEPPAKRTKLAEVESNNLPEVQLFNVGSSPKTKLPKRATKPISKTLTSRSNITTRTNTRSSAADSRRKLLEERQKERAKTSRSSRLNTTISAPSRQSTRTTTTRTRTRTNLNSTFTAQRTVTERKPRIRLEDALNELNTFKEDNEVLKNQCEELNEQLRHYQDLELEVQQLTQKLSTLTQQNMQLETEKRRNDAEVLSLQELNKRLESELIDIRVKIRQVEADLQTEQVQRRIEVAELKSKYEGDIRLLKQEAEIELRRAKDEAARELEDLRNKLNKEINKVKKELETTKIDLDYSEQENKSKAEKIKELEELLSQREATIKQLLEDAQKSEMIRRKLHNTIQELKGNIRVFCRVRPKLKDEEKDHPIEETFKFIKDENGEQKGIDVTGPPQSSATGLKETIKKHQFQFDRVFDPQATQEQVFEEISQLVQSALDGYKVCIFAYGQTGSGKTYTMEGGPGDQKGMIPRSVEQIFKTAKYMMTQGWSYKIQASFLEIYNETIRDLLQKNAKDAEYEIRHDADGNTTVTDLTYVDVDHAEVVYDLLKIASKNRAIGATNMNERSSRSHSVFTLKITGTHESSGQVAYGVLNLIDLAGSERLNQSKATGDRLTETKHINKSLSCLGDVIHALASRSKHVPYRNSKLTHLLQPCLGGDSKTLMFVNISPLYSSLGETLCSLRFASKVNACEIGTARKKTSVKRK